jgi:hypothetical protein
MRRRCFYIFLKIKSQMAVKLASRADRPLPLGGFLVLFYRLSRYRGHGGDGKIRSTEKSDDLIGNRNRDLPSCSIALRPTTLTMCSDKDCRPCILIVKQIVGSSSTYVYTVRSKGKETRNWRRCNGLSIEGYFLHASLSLSHQTERHYRMQ